MAEFVRFKCIFLCVKYKCILRTKIDDGNYNLYNNILARRMRTRRNKLTWKSSAENKAKWNASHLFFLSSSALSGFKDVSFPISNSNYMYKCSPASIISPLNRIKLHYFLFSCSCSFFRVNQSTQYFHFSTWILDKINHIDLTHLTNSITR